MSEKKQEPEGVDAPASDEAPDVTDSRDSEDSTASDEVEDASHGDEAEAAVSSVKGPTPADDTHWEPAQGVPLWQRLAYDRPPVWYRVAQWLLPPLLVAGAVGVHWKLNVPDKILESPRDQGAKNKKKNKKKKKRPRNKRDKPRTDDQFEADWVRLSKTKFDDEPTRSNWARRHQALINRAVVLARREGFEGAPEKPSVVLVDTQCRSVRCRFVLRSPFAHELDVMGEVLDRIEVEGEPLFRSIDVASVGAPEGEPTHEYYLQVTVGFWRERTDTRGLKVASPERAGSDDAGSGGEPPAESGGEEEPSREKPERE